MKISKVNSIFHQHKYLIYNTDIEENKTIKETLESFTLAWVKFSRSTLILHMNEWFVRKYSKSDNTPSLHFELGFLFSKNGLIDEKILRVNNI